MSSGTSLPNPRIGGRVVELVAARSFAINDRPIPEPQSGEARVRILAVGVCGTDVHGYLGRAEALPITLGHDAVGVLDAVGPSTTVSMAVGDRVTIDPTISCGSCVYCQAAKPHLCSAGSYLGMTSPGTMTDFITVPASCLVEVPLALSDVDATVLEPVAVALHLLERIGLFAPNGMHAEVVGGGPLGVLLAQTLVARGWSAVVHEPQPYRRAIAESLGLPVGDASAEASSACGPILVVETSASERGVGLARKLANPGSVIAVVGRAPAEFPTAEILLKELSVIGVRSGVGKYAEAIDLVASGRVRTGATVTHSFDLSDTATAMEWVTDPSREVMRAVLHTTDTSTEKDPT